MKAIQLYCCNAYGSMLWQYNTQYSESFFKAWNVQSRLAWNVPRNTHTNIVESFLCEDFLSIRKQIFARYQNFAASLSRSSSKKNRIRFNLVKTDCRSVTGLNLKFLNILCKCDNILKYCHSLTRRGCDQAMDWNPPTPPPHHTNS